MSSEQRQQRIVCRLDDVLRARGMTLTELSARTGIALANRSILKTNKAKAVRFTTLTAICEALDTTPGELFELGDAELRRGGRAPRSDVGTSAQQPP